MRGLQVLVTVMTVLLFAGMGLLVYGFATKGAELATGAVTAETVEVALPPASTIVQMTPWRDGVALHVRVQKGGEFIYLVRQSGAVAAKLAVTRKADAAAKDGKDSLSK